MEKSFGFRDDELDASCELSQYLNEKRPDLNQIQSLIQTLLASDPNLYIYSRFSMGKPMRNILKRLCKLRKLFNKTNIEPNIETVFLETESPVDIFTADLALGPTILYATTPTGCKIESSGSPDSWAYHCLINGFVHPTTREEIIGFGTIDCGKVNNDYNVEDHLNPVFHYDYDKNIDLEASLSKVIADINEPIAPVEVMLFELECGIPSDRSYINQVLGLSFDFLDDSGSESDITDDVISPGALLGNIHYASDISDF